MPRPRAICCVSLRPAAEALREPTIATAGKSSAARFPRTARRGGASSIIRKAVRILRFAYAKKHRAHSVRGLEFVLGVLTRVDLWRAAAAASSRQCRQCIEGGAGVAKVIDESAEGARTRYYGANAGSFRAVTP